MKEITLNRELTLPNLKKMELSSEAYQIKLLGTDENILRLEVEAEQNEELSEDELKKLFQLEFDQDNEVAKLHIQRHPEINKARFLIELPSKLELLLSNGSAKMQVSNFEGKQTIENQHGRLLMQQNSGELELENENGSSNIENYQGEIKVSNLNGATRLKDCEGTIFMESLNGKIRLSGCSGRLKSKSKNGLVQVGKGKFSEASIENISGIISYEFDEIPAGDFKFQNRNGRIQLIIPDQLEYDLQARSMHGKINVGIPGEYAHSSEEEYKKISMQKASGKVKIFAENMMGGIVLSNKPFKSAGLNSDKGFKFNINFGKHDIDTEELQKDLDATLESVKNSFGKLNLSNLANLKETVFNSINKVIPNQDQPEDLTDDQEIFAEKADNKLKSQRKILELLQSGQITVEDAEKLIDALEGK